MASFIGSRGTEEQRFWRKVKIADNGCWEWFGGRRNGYGAFGLTSPRPGVDGKVVESHRWAYEKYVGLIPDGKELHHNCENKRCVNPSHVEPLTRKEHNSRHPIAGLPAINAKKRFCLRGHPFDKRNTYIYPVTGERFCRLCISIRQKAARKNKQTTKGIK